VRDQAALLQASQAVCHRPLASGGLGEIAVNPLALLVKQAKVGP
jgi:hypothetical protein